MHFGGKVWAGAGHIQLPLHAFGCDFDRRGARGNGLVLLEMSRRACSNVGKSAVDAIFAGICSRSEAVPTRYQSPQGLWHAERSAGQDYLILDRASRTYNFRGLALQDWQDCQPGETESKDKDEARKQVALLTAYAAGIAPSWKACAAHGILCVPWFHLVWWGKSPEIASGALELPGPAENVLYGERQGWEHSI